MLDGTFRILKLHWDTCVYIALSIKTKDDSKVTAFDNIRTGTQGQLFYGDVDPLKKNQQEGLFLPAAIDSYMGSVPGSLLGSMYPRVYASPARCLAMNSDMERRGCRAPLCKT